jgi:ABC-type sugar transport system permease subunit
MSSHLHGRLAQLQKSIYIHLPLIMRIIILDLLSLNNMLKVYDKIWKFCGDTNHGVDFQQQFFFNFDVDSENHIYLSVSMP